MNVTAKEMEAGRKLREFLGFDNDEEMLQEDFENDYLTTNKGKDGKIYVWYLDEKNNAAIEVESLLIINDEEEINDLFGCGI